VSFGTVATALRGRLRVPRLLTQRLQPDSIAQFRVSARIRHEDASQLARSNRGLAAIYLWGYTVEMTVKAAWFALLGYPEHRSIVRSDLEAAKVKAKSYGIGWSGNFHDLEAWAQLLIQHRAASNRPYSVHHFDKILLDHSRRVYHRWRESLRYKRNVPYRFEVEAVAESAEWFLTNSRDL
jgi:hypothetical protein